MIDKIIVAVFMASAIAYIVYIFGFKNRKNPGCAGCDKCGDKAIKKC